MKILNTSILGAYIIVPTMSNDDRGFFARTWDPAIAHAHGLLSHFDYTCISGNTKKHTLRGMHYQREPHEETKLVRCTKGSIFDVVIDLRPSSATFQQWVSAELSAENHRALYIPPGFAHGFMTLKDDTEVLYDMSGAYEPTAASGVRFDDPSFAIHWPSVPTVISPRDASYPDFL